MEKLKSSPMNSKKLVRTLVHDLSNYIMIVNGHLKLLKRNIHSNEHLNKTLEIVYNISDLISGINVLDSLHTHGPDHYECREPLESQLNNVIGAFEKPIQKKDLQVYIVVDDSQASITINSAIFKYQIFGNILSNAIKFSEPDSTIMVRAFTEKDYLCITVEDEGIGIPEELQPFLFDWTRQAQRRGTDGEQGTGYGLAIVYEILTIYKGELEVTSPVNTETGRGTIVKISIPQNN